MQEQEQEFPERPKQRLSKVILNARTITANFVYHRICLTQIKLFRFIGFRFV
jgi:hypothetical protein